MIYPLITKFLQKLFSPILLLKFKQLVTKKVPFHAFFRRYFFAP